MDSFIHGKDACSVGLAELAGMKFSSAHVVPVVVMKTRNIGMRMEEKCRTHDLP
jgi:hypothetical protein